MLPSGPAWQSYGCHGSVVPLMSPEMSVLAPVEYERKQGVPQYSLFLVYKVHLILLGRD
jgi:hypothetical protein